MAVSNLNLLFYTFLVIIIHRFQCVIAENSTVKHLPIPINIDDGEITNSSIKASWEIPSNNTTFGKVEKVVLHYAEVSNASNHFMKELLPNVTSYRIGGLLSGTGYDIFLEFHFDRGGIGHSQHVIIETHGVGPEASCDCDEQGTYNSTCVSKGSILQCSCRPHYAGHRCEKCDDGYFRLEGESCQSCPCSNMTSTGHCHVTDAKPVCNECNVGYAGHFCEDCAPNYYSKVILELNTTRCTKCSCNGNVDKSYSKKWCNSLTGYCTRCTYNTTGRHCERCQTGYIGDPIHFKNCTHIDDIPRKNPTSGSSSTLTTVIVAVAVSLLVISLAVAAVFGVRRYMRWRRKPFAFWTVELSGNHENVQFTGINTDSELLMEDMEMYYHGEGANRTEPRVFQVT